MMSLFSSSLFGNEIVTLKSSETEIKNNTGAIFLPKINSFTRSDIVEIKDNPIKYSITYGSRKLNTLIVSQLISKKLIGTDDLKSIIRGLIKGKEKRNNGVKVHQSGGKTLNVGGRSSQGIFAYISFKRRGKEFDNLLSIYPWDDNYFIAISSTFPFVNNKKNIENIISKTDSYISTIGRK